MLRRELLWAASGLVAVKDQLSGENLPYGAEIAEWRKTHELDLRSEKGPLFLIARHDVPEGKTGIGSDPSNGISLPDRAPKTAGYLDRQSNKVTFTPAPGSAMTLNGARISGPAELRTASPADRLAFGDFEMGVSEVGGQFHLTVRDRQSPFLKQFKGSLWFPVNGRYRVPSALTRYSQPKELKIPDTAGRARPRMSPGYVTFRLNDETLRLEPVELDNVLFFMFKDRTAGRETYGAGRYLDADLPKGDTVIMDFNKAYNPYCAVNPYSSCPIPPRSNILPVRIEAGEKFSGDH